MKDLANRAYNHIVWPKIINQSEHRVRFFWGPADSASDEREVEVGFVLIQASLRFSCGNYA